MNICKGLDPTVTIASKILVIGFVIFCAVMAEQAGVIFQEISTSVLNNFKWFYLALVTGVLGFLFYLMVSRFGHIRLGKDDEKPEFSYLAWVSMLFSGGMGIGLIFWSVAEPMYHYAANPFSADLTAESATTAMRLTFFHWGLHPWATFIIVALSLAYFAYRKGLPLTLRSILYPFIGNRIYGPIGDTVDILTVGITAFGVSQSPGLGVIQMNSGGQNYWTAFYWPWWMTWAPFVGMFIARISRGRTIREMIGGALIVPTLVTCVWMSVFGGSALYQEMQARTAYDNAVAADISVADTPFTGGPILQATQADTTSALFAMFEGLDPGGLKTIQTASIIAGLPIAFFILLMTVSLYRTLRREPMAAAMLPMQARPSDVNLDFEIREITRGLQSAMSGQSKTPYLTGYCVKKPLPESTHTGVSRGSFALLQQTEPSLGAQYCGGRTNKLTACQVVINQLSPTERHALPHNCSLNQH